MVAYDDGPLFSGISLDVYLAARLQDAMASVGALGASDLTDIPTTSGQDGSPASDETARAALEDRAVDAITATSKVRGVTFEFPAIQRTELSEDRGVLATTISIPFTGDPELLNLGINHIAVYSDDVRGTVVRGTVVRGEYEPSTDQAIHRLVFWLRHPDLDTQINALITQRRSWLKSKVAFTNRTVETWNIKLETEVRTAVSRRAALLRRMQAAESAMTIPVIQRQDPPIALPVSRRTLDTPPIHTRTSPSDDGGDRSGAWVLEDAVYEEVVRTLVLFAGAAGRLPASAGKLNENDFRNFALLVLNANFDFTNARGEVFNGKGKSDLLVPWVGGNAFVAEFKRYDGPPSVINALTQLLGYVTWADTKAALVILIDRADVTAALREVHAAVEAHPMHVRTEPAGEPDRRRDYVVTSLRDALRLVKLAVVPIVIDETIAD